MLRLIFASQNLRKICGTILDVLGGIGAAASVHSSGSPRSAKKRLETDPINGRVTAQRSHFFNNFVAGRAHSRDSVGEFAQFPSSSCVVPRNACPGNPLGTDQHGR